MPALIDRMDPLLADSLRDSGVPLVTQRAAVAQRIPTARLVLANMMPAPAMQATERQWGEHYCSDPDVAVAIDLAKFKNDCREGIDPETGEERSRTENLKRYTEIPSIETPVNVLVVTGDNLEIEPRPEGLSSRKPRPIELDDISYGKRLQSLVRWGERHAATAIPACLGSHFVLNYFHNLPKQTLDEKVFGVYEHEILDPHDPIVRGLGDSILAPHSRWGDVSIKQIEDHNKRLPAERQLKILAASDQAGWLILKEVLPNGHVRVYLQGHPEYDRDDLRIEYERDIKRGQALPANYFPGDDPANTPRHNWAPAAHALSHNIMRLSRGIGTT